MQYLSINSFFSNKAFVFSSIFLFNFFCLIIIYLIQGNLYWQTNDDTQIQFISENVVLNQSKIPSLVFIQPFFAYFIHFLRSIYPLQWYPLIMLFLILISLTIVFYKITTKNSFNYNTLLLYICVNFFVYFNLQFTLVSGLLAISACLLIADIESFKLSKLILISFILSFISALIRFEAFGLVFLLFILFKLVSLDFLSLFNIINKPVLTTMFFIIIFILINYSIRIISYEIIFPEWGDYFKKGVYNAKIFDYGYCNNYKFINLKDQLLFYRIQRLNLIDTEYPTFEFIKNTCDKCEKVFVRDIKLSNLFLHLKSFRINSSFVTSTLIVFIIFLFASKKLKYLLIILISILTTFLIGEYYNKYVFRVTSIIFMFSIFYLIYESKALFSKKQVILSYIVFLIVFSKEIRNEWSKMSGIKQKGVQMNNVIQSFNCIKKDEFLYFTANYNPFLNYNSLFYNLPKDINYRNMFFSGWINRTPIDKKHFEDLGFKLNFFSEIMSRKFYIYHTSVGEDLEYMVLFYKEFFNKKLHFEKTSNPNIYKFVFDN